jgi:phosphoribosylaminoimidazole-succinocarboxamide synthase
VSDAISQTNLPLPVRRGKVRDVYDLEEHLPGHLLLVATDRISAYDVILPTPIPGKGRLLTQISRFWFDHFRDVPNHLSDEPVPVEVTAMMSGLGGRGTIVRKLDIVPFECVARGYLAGSGWREYQATQSVCGIDLPAGLTIGSKLPEPIFTPATKADQGHDENVSFEQMADAIGGDLAAQLRNQTLRLFEQASDFAATKGILLADTKLEFGLDEGQPVLADEVLTPDSSRFWPADAWQPGFSPPSFDKQFVRDYLATLDWDRQPPGPELPHDIVEATRDRYVEARRRLTGS